LISQPSKRSEGKHSVRADDNQSFQSVPDAWKSGVPTISADSILNQQVGMAA
jgi:hypothetical protein